MGSGVARLLESPGKDHSLVCGARSLDPDSGHRRDEENEPQQDDDAAEEDAESESALRHMHTLTMLTCHRGVLHLQQHPRWLRLDSID